MQSGECDLYVLLPLKSPVLLVEERETLRLRLRGTRLVRLRSLEREERELEESESES
jgi:hypothetical protein